MAYKKGEKIETGIWRLAGSKLYVAEADYRDPETGRQTRLRKTWHRIDDLRSWRQTSKADLIRGVLRRDKKREPVRFDRFAKDYLKAWGRDRKLGTVKREGSRITGTLKEAFGARSLHTIKQKDIEDFLARRQDEGASTATTNRDLCRIKNMFKKAMEWGIVDANPAATIKQAKEVVEEADFLTKEEVNDLIKACGPRLKPLVTVAVNTGMRWSELANLEWRDVHSGRKIITLRDTKNGESRYVPMNRAVRDTLDDLRKQQARERGRIQKLVFASRLGDKPMKDVRKPYKKALKDAGIDETFTFHGLRHTAASHLVMSGVDLRTVGMILGHKTAQITLRYAHLAPDFLKGAVDKLNYSVEDEVKEVGGEVSQ